jgi:hypothetical protein
MILSDRNRFVLLAPWKAASSTAHARLGHYNESPYSRFYDYVPYLQRVVTQHITCAEFVMLPESRKGYFVGAFVRNPYDRVYSGFLQLQRDIREQPAAPFPEPWIKALVMRQLSDNFAQLAAANFDFDTWFSSVEAYQIFEVGRNTSFPLHPAHYWTNIDGERKVGFVGKVEQFERDFDAFCEAVGIPRLEDRTSANMSDGAIVAESNTASPYRYIDRMSRASISKINSLFQDDFSAFGYERINA